MKAIKGIKQNISLKNYTTFKIGGKVKYFAEVKNLQELKKIIQWTKDNHLSFFILGNGSNVLFSDKGYQGIIIKIKNSTLKKINQTVILVDAGLSLGEFLNKCVQNQWRGFEWMAGIPGTIGGAIYGNAGAFGKEMKNFVKKIITLNPQSFKIKHYLLSQCKFGYRESIFKKNQEIILAVELRVKKGNQAEIQKIIQENWQYKLQHQMFKYPSAGSIFKNIILRETPYQKAYNAKKQLVKIQDEEVQVKGGKISAGWFIEKCGLKGKIRGGAKISDFHANVIINFKQAKAKDILFLINLIKKSVWKKFQISLEEEIVIIDDF
jgi:UDP-N-acetylmuramate dehydrogenase